MASVPLAPLARHHLLVTRCASSSFVFEINKGVITLVLN